MVVYHPVRDGAGIPPRLGFDLAAGLERVMGDRAMLLRVLGRFGVDYRDLTARLHAALDAGDHVLAQRIAHTLKGAAAMIEAAQLRALALEVELALKSSGRLPETLVKELDDELARVLADVDALLAAPEPVTAALEPDGTSSLDALRTMLDIGDGRAPELLARMRPRLLAELGGERLAALETAVRRFDFEGALALLAPVDQLSG